jgi:hypothetical protein
MFNSPMKAISLLVGPFFLLACVSAPSDESNTSETLSSEITKDHTPDRLTLQPIGLSPVLEWPSVNPKSCEMAGIPQIQSIDAWWSDDRATISLDIQGQTCSGIPEQFAFRVLDGDGKDITGRSWPEVDEVHLRPDGTFTLQGKAATCSDFSKGVTISVFFYNETFASDGQSINIR